MTDKPLDDIDGLAAEHVLGSLPPAERAEVARRLATDRRLADAVAAWEHRLAPLSLREPGLPPPPRALEDALAAVAAQAGAATAANVVMLRRRADRWRAAAAGFAALAAALALAVPAADFWRAPPVHYAFLAATTGDTADEAATAGRPLFLAMADAGRRAVSLRQVGGRPAPGGRSYVLWLTGADGRAVRRIGALAQDERARSFTTDAPVPAGATILLTIEAEPLADAPRGPVVASGRLMAAEP